MVKRWFHRDEGDASGLVFVEWDPEEERQRRKNAVARGGLDVPLHEETPPVAMLVNSKEVRGVGFDLIEVLPPPLLAQVGRRVGAARAVKTKGARVSATEGMGERKLRLLPRTDNTIRELCDS